MARSESVPASAPLDGRLRAQVVEPLIAATCATLHEMASADVSAQSIDQTRSNLAPEDLHVVTSLTAGIDGVLTFSFPKETAAAFARRILGGVAQNADAALIQDCVCEIANVVAGQAKALLAKTPYRFRYSIPQAAAMALAETSGVRVRIQFVSDLGEFALELHLK